MDGIHDMGGMQGFGPIGAQGGTEPPFHEPWEGRVHGLMLACAANPATGGSIRRWIEAMGHDAYLTTSYYEHWLAGLEAKLVAKGVLGADELAARQAEVRAGATVPRREDPEAAAFVRSLLQPFAVDDPAEPAPRYAVGDDVRVRRMHPEGHTRCPRYVRGAVGTIALVHAPQPLPDLVAQGEVRDEPYYTVAFTPAELWGGDAEPGAATIHVDLWESYLA